MRHADTVLAVLHHKLEKEVVMFQEAQSELTRDIVEVIAPIWPSTVLMKLKRLAGNPERLRVICSAIRDDGLAAEEEVPDSSDPEISFALSRVRSFYSQDQHLVVSAALRFLESTDTPGKIRFAEMVGKSIVAVLAI